MFRNFASKLAATALIVCAATIHAEPPRFIINTIAGNHTPGFSGDGGPATAAQLDHPTAVAVSSKGEVYIADNNNSRVRVVGRDGVIRTVMGTGETGMQHEELPALETNIVSAYGIAVDPSDNLYVFSRGHNKLFKVGADGTGRLLSGDGRRAFDGDGGPASAAHFNSANHMVADDAGNLYIADSGNRRVRKIDAKGIVTTIDFTGEEGFSGDGGPATQATMTGGSAIARDASGNLFVADFNNHRIRKISTDGIVTTIAGTGEKRFNGDGLPATTANLGEPTGVDVDRDGNVFISDQVNNRVRVVTADGLLHTVAGVGKIGWTGDGGPAEEAKIFIPDILDVDAEGNVYFADHQNNVVRKLTRR